MHVTSFLTAVLLSCASVASAARVVITVGANKTADASQIFQPQSVTANINDVVVFNFTNGTHTASQADFASPCLLINSVNSTINGFNSGERAANNGTSITTLEVTITSNASLWFFDHDTCAMGGVGVINMNASSGQTLAGFTRNAIRLNGTGTASSAFPSSTGNSNNSSTGGGSSSTDTNTTSTDGSGSSGGAAANNVIVGTAVALPLAVIALLL